ncbi:glycoside hydrolase family 88 protein [Crepidotus variabilis]|uniref:Glycoside hydrolase family 88 protein n=1 Tax=Crepidotus variabilis TaxID=179855 RepID=A0A9P6ER52_9AGAR|nr:glycoside hydrolase family 88 protein [Crepidotus variabilis]
MKLQIIALKISILVSHVLAAAPAQLFSPLVAQKVHNTFKLLPNPLQFPHTTDSTKGAWGLVDPNWWTSGFFPGTGYLMNTRKALCGDPTNELGTTDWLALSRSASNALLSLTDKNGIGHDVGFISFPFIEELTINPNNQTAINAVNRFAGLLAARFNSVVGCTRSWDTSDPTDFQVIIDNMMNLEVLFVSAALTRNKTLENIAIRHADTTQANHIRSDGSSWHVVEYNSTTGVAFKKRTAQGYSDSSTWTRGQAWGVYGFANMYRHTQKASYLDTARKMATYFINNTPSDGVIPWDFNAPLTPTPRPADTSAAMLAVNAFLMLAQYDPAAGAKDKWTNAALQLLGNNVPFAWKTSWQSLLSNGTSNKPSNNFNTGLVYGDYYFVLAGNELLKRNLTTCS